MAQEKEALANLGRVTGPGYPLVNQSDFKRAYSEAVTDPLANLIEDSIKRGLALVRPETPHKAGIPPVLSQAALRWLLTRIGWAADQVGEETSKLLGQALADGFAAGESMLQIADRVRQVFDMSDMRSLRIARTETIAASSQGALAGYKESGIVSRAQFYTAIDERTCEDCNSLHNEIFPVDDAAAMIPIHPNCLLPDVRVEASHLISGSRAFYRGKAIEITTENGNILTCTPNHMILTPKGFMKGKALCEGDYIISSSQGERIVSSIDPYHNHTPTPIEDIWNSLVMQEGMLISSVPVSAEDFYGDAGCFNGNVDIIYPDSFLGSKNYAFGSEHFTKNNLNSRNPQSQSLVCPGTPFSFSNGLMTTPGGNMGSRSSGLALCERHLRHRNNVGLATIARDNTSIQETLSDNIPAYTELSRQFQFRFTNLIAPEQIIKVRYFDYIGHVYDLQSLEQLYIANSIIAKNCRCVWLPVIED